MGWPSKVVFATATHVTFGITYSAKYMNVCKPLACFGLRVFRRRGLHLCLGKHSKVILLGPQGCGASLPCVPLAQLGNSMTAPSQLVHFVIAKIHESRIGMFSLLLLRLMFLRSEVFYSEIEHWSWLLCIVKRDKVFLFTACIRVKPHSTKYSQRML